ncbi:MAG TPA: methyl-accepting chemotaxis protein [Bacillus sp. (in: firmicutes)]|nr:methyl-accepting chemotaxis protein [Bacillus sp. (in: firmicutes)]
MYILKRTLTWQLGTIIVGIILISLLITSVATYKTAYDKIYEAAGIEAYGCANITTGLLNPQEVERILEGDRQLSSKVGNQLNWTTAHKDIFETQYILDLNGTILALDRNLAEKGFKVGDSFYMDQKAVNMLKKMKHSTYSDIYEYGSMKRLSGYAPIFKDHDPQKEIIAISVIDFNADIVTERTWDVIKGGVLLSFIPMIIASLVTVWLIRRKTKPISDLILHAGKMANGDLSVEDIEVKSNDEVGDLTRTLNTMTANLKEMISTLTVTSSSLAKNAEGTSVSIDEINSALQQVSNSMEEVAADTLQGTEHAAEAATALSNLASSIQAAKEKANDSARNSKETMATAQLGQRKVNEIFENMHEIKSATLDTEQTIKELSSYANEIQKITETINGIAAQTNLLALNASIEAARAGEHGKGFAVVASEVRNLAEQSNQEVAEVEKLVKKITNSIGETVHSIQQSRQSVQKGEQTVHETGAALEKILEAVSNTVDEINHISVLTNEEAATSDKIVQLIQSLSRSIANMAANTEEISAAAVETSAAIDKVANRSHETSDIAKKLNEVGGKFKL